MTLRKVGLLLILSVSFLIAVEAHSPRGTAKVGFDGIQRRIQQDKEREQEGEQDNKNNQEDKDNGDNDNNGDDKNNDKNNGDDDFEENDSTPAPTSAPVFLPTFSPTSNPTIPPLGTPPVVDFNTDAPTSSPSKRQPQSATPSPDVSLIYTNPTVEPDSDVINVEAPLLDFNILLKSEFSELNVTELDKTLEMYLNESMVFRNIEQVSLKVTGSEMLEEDSGQTYEPIQVVSFQGHLVFTWEAPTAELLHAQQEAVLMDFYSLQKSIDNNAGIGSGVALVDVNIGGSTEEIIGEEQEDIGDWFYEGKEQARPVIVGATVTFTTMAINVLMLALRYRAILNK